MSRRSRVAPTFSSRDNRKPACKHGHPANQILRLHGMWVCAECLKIESKEKKERERLGIALPSGVELDNEKPLALRDVYVNRRHRRLSKAL